MKEALKNLLDTYPLQTQENYINALREIVQQIALLGLWRAKFFESAAFYGATALRIFYGLNRFSEDVDFSLLKTNPSFDLTPYLKAIQDELESFSFQFSVERKVKSRVSQIESAFIKGNTTTNLILVEAPANLISRFHQNQKLKVKLEVDIDPPSGAKYETKFLLRPIPFSVRLYTLPNLFAGKLHAVLCRGWQNRVKGRYFYDLVWYLGQKTPCHLEHLKLRMIQSGHWDDSREFNRSILLQLLDERFESLDFEKVKADVRPFIKDQDELSLWDKTFFIEIIKDIKVQ